MSEEPAGWELVIPFLTADPKWVLGFEAGYLYGCLTEDPPPQSASTMIHVENEDQVRVMAGRLGYDYQRREVGDGWLEIALVRRE